MCLLGWLCALYQSPVVALWYQSAHPTLHGGEESVLGFHTKRPGRLCRPTAQSHPAPEVLSGLESSGASTLSEQLILYGFFISINILSKASDIQNILCPIQSLISARVHNLLPNFTQLHNKVSESAVRLVAFSKESLVSLSIFN